MKYAKLVNNMISYAPRKIRHNGRWYFNASEDIMRMEGWLPVILVEPPEIPDGYMLRESWAITDDPSGRQVIIEVWNVVPIPSEAE